MPEKKTINMRDYFAKKGPNASKAFIRSVEDANKAHGGQGKTEKPKKTQNKK